MRADVSQLSRHAARSTPCSLLPPTPYPNWNGNCGPGKVLFSAGASVVYHDASRGKKPTKCPAHLVSHRAGAIESYWSGCRPVSSCSTATEFWSTHLAIHEVPQIQCGADLNMVTKPLPQWLEPLPPCAPSESACRSACSCASICAEPARHAASSGTLSFCGVEPSGVRFRSSDR
eukprot:scaffold29206_cov75-Phaeocystis_antarctica.AAC.5